MSTDGVDLRALPDVIAELADRSGGPFVVEFPAPLPEHALKLMATLGVEVSVVSVYVGQTRKPLVTGGAPVAFETRPPLRGPARRISRETCAKCPDSGRCLRDKFCWRAQLAERLLVARAKAREDRMGSRLEALERMDAGERQVEKNSTSGSTIDPDNGKRAIRGGRQPRWAGTHEQIIEAIVQWAEQHDGQPPGFNDWAKASPARPSSFKVRQEFGSWNRAIKLAGLEPRGPDAGMKTRSKPVSTKVAPNRSEPTAVKPPPAEKPSMPEPRVPVEALLPTTTRLTNEIRLDIASMTAADLETAAEQITQLAEAKRSVEAAEDEVSRLLGELVA